MGRSLIVTGAAGFIGSRFVQLCKEHGYDDVISVDDPSYFEARTEHKGVPYGRVIDRAKLFEVLEREKLKPAGIVHLGACTDTTELDVEYLTKMNLSYSQKLWKYCTENKIPLVYASSAATYGDGAEGYDDNESLIPRLKPLNPYGQSKQDFDVWALAEEKAGRTPPSWSGFKFFNVYGMGERHKEKMASVIVHSFDQIRAQGFVRLFKSHREGIADGHQKRDFIFVDDLVSVLFFALEKPIKRGIFNLGSGTARTFLDLTRATFKEMGVKENIEFIDTPVSIRDRYQYFTEAKMEKLRREGYTKPFATLEEGVRKYVAWLKDRV